MTARDEAIEAVARVFRDDMPRVQPRAPWEGSIGNYFGWTTEQTAAAVVDVVTPIIRADERRQMEMAAVIDREEIADEVRERIAQEIEAEHTRCRPIPMLTGSFYFSCSHFEDARIARGGTR